MFLKRRNVELPPGVAFPLEPRRVEAGPKDLFIELAKFRLSFRPGRRM